VLIAMSALAGSVALLLIPVRVAEVAAQQATATGVVRSFGGAWNAHQLDAVLAAFASDATIEGEFGCCAAKGPDQIRSFVQARFAEDHRIALGEPQVKGDTLIFLSRIFARDGLNGGVSLTTGGGPDDPEAAPVRFVVVNNKITSLHLGISKAAVDRAQTAREGRPVPADAAVRPPAVPTPSRQPRRRRRPAVTPR
jgi:ketosteroid isomerase-like protein